MIKFEKVSLKEWLNWFTNSGKQHFSEEFLTRVWGSIKLPKRSTEWSAGYDFFAPFDMDVVSEWQTFPTGIRFVTDNPNVCLVLVPRSGLGFKHNLKLANTVGLIDADYQFSENEGHIAVRINAQNYTAISSGKAFAQGIILFYLKTDDDETDGKRNGGFGSTDKEKGHVQ